MTIDEMMLRGMMDAEKDRLAKERADGVRYLRRWRKAWKVIEAAVLTLTLAGLALLAWCCVSETPHRMFKDISRISAGGQNER